MASTVVSNVSTSIAPVLTKAKQDFTPFASAGADGCERLQLAPALPSIKPKASVRAIATVYVGEAPP